VTKSVEHTNDGRYVIVNGRKWRATNPNIPASLRAELVKELMAARRAVKHAKGNETATAAARTRVGHAKTALGERGEPWWEPGTDEGLCRRIRSAIHALLAARDPTSSICPSEAARIVAAPNWRPVMDTVRSVAVDMAAEGLIDVTQRGDRIGDPGRSKGPVRYRLAATHGTSD